MRGCPAGEAATGAAYDERVLVRLPTPPRSLRRTVALAAVVTQAGIAVTGSVVRVTGSGLGCPTWPRCFPGSLTPVPHEGVDTITQWVEFGNRLLTPLVGVVAVACLALALLARRRRLVALAAAMTIGTALQAVVGGITVLTGLVWWTVALHFLISMVLVWLAVLLVAAFGEGDAAPRWHVTTPLRALLATATAVLAALLVAGTLVTAAGPHAGDAATPRLDADIPTLVALHSGMLVAYLGLLAGLGFALRAVGAAGVTRRRYGLLLAAVLAQGSLGAAQYATGVPELLVSLHVLGAALVVVAMASLWAGSRDRGPVPAVTEAQPPGGVSVARTAEANRNGAPTSA
ncbi:MAG: heme A synthase [Pseudonocardiaceae bacterium]|nr:heme A synthase [Pseudonocardiaceae bacterium]